jgi:type IV secretion system protein VirB3
MDRRDPVGNRGTGRAVWAAKRDLPFVDVVRLHLRIAGHLGV